MSAESTDAPLADTLAGVQRRTVWVLSLGQILGGVAFGATLSLGAVLAADISGDDALSGLAAAAVTLRDGHVRGAPRRARQAIGQTTGR